MGPLPNKVEHALLEHVIDWWNIELKKHLFNYHMLLCMLPLPWLRRGRSIEDYEIVHGATLQKTFLGSPLIWTVLEEKHGAFTVYERAFDAIQNSN